MLSEKEKSAQTDDWICGHPADGPYAGSVNDVRPVTVIKVDAREVHTEESVTVSAYFLFIKIGRQFTADKDPEICTDKHRKQFQAVKIWCKIFC